MIASTVPERSGLGIDDHVWYLLLFFRSKAEVFGVEFGSFDDPIRVVMGNVASWLACSNVVAMDNDWRPLYRHDGYHATHRDTNQRRTPTAQRYLKYKPPLCKNAT